MYSRHILQTIPQKNNILRSTKKAPQKSNSLNTPGRYTAYSQCRAFTVYGSMMKRLCPYLIFRSGENRTRSRSTPTGDIYRLLHKEETTDKQTYTSTRRYCSCSTGHMDQQPNKLPTSKRSQPQPPGFPDIYDCYVTPFGPRSDKDNIAS